MLVALVIMFVLFALTVALVEVNTSNCECELLFFPVVGTNHSYSLAPRLHSLFSPGVNGFFSLTLTTIIVMNCKYILACTKIS